MQSGGEKVILLAPVRSSRPRSREKERRASSGPGLEVFVGRNGDARGCFVADRATKQPLASPLRPTNTSSPGPLDALRSFSLDRGLLLRTGASNITFSPPLCISDEELRRAFALLDEGLALVDARVAHTS